MTSRPSSRAALFFGVGHGVTALVVGVGVFAGLPARWWPVDVGAGLLVALQLAAVAALVRETPWSTRILRTAAAVALAMGLFLVTTLTLTAGWLSGVYGPVGQGGAIVLVLVAALVLPYLVVLPLAELAALQPRRRAAG